MINNVKAIQKTMSQTTQWVNELMERGAFADENEAFVLLRSTLKALRDRITHGEALHLGSQLPALLRGYYFEGWNIDKEQTKERSVEDFLSTVRFHLGGHSEIDLQRAVPTVLKVIFDKIDRGEAEDVIHNLPKEIQQLCS